MKKSNTEKQIKSSVFFVYLCMKIEKSSEFPCFEKIKHNIKDFQVKYKNARKLAGDIELPGPGEAVYIWLQGNFIFGDFFIQLLQEKNIGLKELTIITLSIGEDNIAALEALIEKKWVGRINFLVSGYFLRTEKVKHTKSIMLLERVCQNHPDNFKVYYSNTHQKICLMETEKGEKFVFHGSANMKGSQNYEQLMIDNNDKLYDFNYQYFSNLIQNQNGKIRE